MTMAQEQSIGSILLADCGTVITKAVLLEQVAGQYRLIARGTAPTTVDPPWSDVTIGIRHAVEQISEVTGRHFFDSSGNLIHPERPGREGVDAFAATISAAEPLQVVLGGLVRDLSVSSAARATAGTYSVVKAILATDGEGGTLSEEKQVRSILDASPDVICIAGGVEGGAVTPVLDLVETATLACSMINASVRPRLLYMGNSQLRQQVAEIVNGQAEQRATDNVYPTPGDENVQGAQADLNLLYVKQKMGRLPGIEKVRGWSSVPPSPTARAFGRMVEYLWHLGDHTRGVIGVDVGASSTTLAAVFDGNLALTIRGNLGGVFGGEHLIEQEGAASLTRWIPEPMEEGEALGMLINRASHPTSIHQEPRELWLGQALAREAILSALKVAHRGWRTGATQPYPDLLPLCDTIVVRGGVLAHAPRPGQAALIVLDALEPIGVSTLVLDAYDLAPALGSTAQIKPLATVEALDGGAFVNLATVVAPVGRGRRGETALRVQVTYETGGGFSADVAYGDLEVLPLLPGQEAVVELHPTRRFDVGLGGPGKGGKRIVSGGLAGLIVDARGRPLRLPDETEQRQSQVRQWLWDVGG
jgi:hypothetical protein